MEDQDPEQKKIDDRRTCRIGTLVGAVLVIACVVVIFEFNRVTGYCENFQEDDDVVREALAAGIDSAINGVVDYSNVNMACLPADAFSFADAEKLATVTSIKFSNNGLRRISPEIFGETEDLNVETFEVSYNQISTLPSNIFVAMSKVKTLIATVTRLDDLPETLFNNTPALEEIVLDYNPDLTTIPAAFGVVAENLNTVSFMSCQNLDVSESQEFAEYDDIEIDFTNTLAVLKYSLDELVEATGVKDASFILGNVPSSLCGTEESDQAVRDAVRAAVLALGKDDTVLDLSSFGSCLPGDLFSGIDGEALEKLSSITEISFVGAGLREVKFDVFYGYPKESSLKKVNFGGNTGVKIPVLTFVPLDTVAAISLEGTEITESTDIPLLPKTLSYLNLAGTAFTRIELPFQLMDAIGTLILANSGVESFAPNVFRDVTIEKIDLSFTGFDNEGPQKATELAAGFGLDPTKVEIILSTLPPTQFPTPLPSESPTGAPIGAPTEAPIQAPTGAPIGTPTLAPIQAPTGAPIGTPTLAPIGTPTGTPTTSPVPEPASPPGDSQDNTP